MDIKHFVSIKLESAKPEDILLSEALASRLSLSPPSISDDSTPFKFMFHESRLELHDNSAETQSKGLFVDFLAGAAFYRFKTEKSIHHPLAKAVGIKKGVRPTICDATAGFGADSFVLAYLGCKVTMVERSPFIWALLDDGIRRALSNPEIKEIFRSLVSLHLAESIFFLKNTNNRFQTIYLDPMYPHRKKSALNKMRMRLLRSVVGDDEDSARLLTTARKHALQRVVVKRPAGAPFIGQEKPSYAVVGKNSRYDVYLTNHL